ncbi:ATP-binding protein, partial [Rhodococcus hoagii]|nr:ATP-binding protein [Prescottella equi]
FDATAGYESASLNADDVRDTRWARAAVAALDDASTRTTRAGLMFFGPTGIGKTWAGFAICNAAVQRFGADSVRFATEETLLGGDVAPWELHGRLQSWLRGHLWCSSMTSALRTGARSRCRRGGRSCAPRLPGMQVRWCWWVQRTGRAGMVTQGSPHGWERKRRRGCASGPWTARRGGSIGGRALCTRVGVST